MDLEKLEKWLNEHSEEADIPVMNISTQKAFTVREVFDQLKQEAETGVKIVDKDLLEVQSNIEQWLKEV
jgi:hypothetical protein